MKKLYLFIFAVMLTASTFAQIGSDWWMMLPQDWKTNVYVRDTIQIANVADDFVAGYEVLADLWADVEAVEVDIDNRTAGPDVDGEGDLEAKGKLFWDSNNLYILFNVLDQEVDTARDLVEIHTAPYGCFYQPDREIYPLGFAPGWVNPKTPDPYDYEFGDRKIPGLEYVAMAQMGSWTEAGAYKMDINLKTKEEVYPNSVVYTMRGPDKDTLGNVSSGAPEVPLTTVFEETEGGYLFLVIEPWAVMNEMVPEEGVFESMSLGIKVNDFDSDNADGTDENTDPDRADYWGGTTSNDAYWAIAYYGAVGKLFDVELEPCTLPEGVTFVESVEISGEEDVTTADQEVDLDVTILPAEASQFVLWKVVPDSAVVNDDGVVSGFSAGTYSIKVAATAIDGSGVTDTVEMNVNIPLTGIRPNEGAKFAAFPSPAKDQLTISNTQLVSHVDVVSIVGQTVASYTNRGNNRMELNVAGLRQGVYMLNIHSQEGVTTLRFIKQ